MAAADYRMMTDATGQDLVAALQNIAPLQVAPLVVSIPTGQWSGSGNDYYITVNASNVSVNSILVPCYDADSRSRLNGPVWCVPAAGSFTIHTSAIPSGTVTILVQFPGVMGEAQYQVLADVYSKSQAVAKADIVNNLTSTATNQPLSANMGNYIKRVLGNIVGGDKNTSTVSIPTSTPTLCSSISLAAGTWVVVACADWQENAAGYRQIAFASSTNPGRNIASTIQGLSEKEAYQQVVRIMSTEGETLNVYALQNSGNTINMYPYLYAIKMSV